MFSLVNRPFNNKVFIRRTVCEMVKVRDNHPSYDRLIKILQAKSGLKNPAAIAHWLSNAGYTISEQGLNNWSRRGVSRQGAADIGLKIGFDPVDVIHGPLPADEHRKAKTNISLYATKQEEARNKTNDAASVNIHIQRIIHMMKGVDEDQQIMCVGAVASILGVKPPTLKNLKQRTGT